MANSPQAIKRARQNIKRRVHNQALRSDMRTQIKSILTLITAKDTAALKKAFSMLCSKADRLARKGQVSPHKAARIKSRINKRIKEANK